MQIDELSGIRLGIGEGAMWDDRERRLYAVDVMARQFIRYDPESGALERFDVPGVIGAIALHEDGGAILGLADGVYRYDFADRTCTRIVTPEPDASLLLTEGKADPAGRFVVSSMGLAMQDPVGSFYSVRRGSAVERLRGGIVTPNGLAWSPDGRTMYFADSGRSTVFACDYDPDTGTTANERRFVDTTDLGGVPDGATTDRDGHYWLAICRAGLIVRYDADGAELSRLSLPTRWVASIAFGGEDGADLFVTTIDPSVMGMGEDAEGGKLFIVRGLGARGMGAHRVSG